MEFIKLLESICKNLENILPLSETTYLTVVFGQIAIWGILLTFYQFVASRSEKEYLGIKIDARYYSNILFEKVISSKLFITFFILNILAYPTKVILEENALNRYISLVTLFWTMFFVIYLVMFAWMFWRCAVLISKCNKMSGEQVMKEVSRSINKREVLRCKLRGILGREIDAAYDSIVNVISKCQNEEELRISFVLIENIVDWYLYKKKKRNHTKSNVKGRRNEYELFSKKELELLRYLQEELKAKKCVDLMLNVFFSMLNSYLLTGIDLKYDELFYFEHFTYCYSNGLEDRLAVGAWNRLLEEIEKNCTKESLSTLCNILTTFEKYYANRHICLVSDFYERALKSLVRTEVGRVFMRELDAKEFNDLYSKIISDDSYNRFFVEVLADFFESPNFEYDDAVILDNLSIQNSEYLFVFLFLYFSVYRFRFEWNRICINVLKKLWSMHDDFEKSIDYISEMIGKTNASHRIDSELVKCIIACIKKKNEAELYNSLYAYSELNDFYVFVMKTCIIEQPFSFFNGDLCDEVKCDFINDLSKHEEIACNSKTLEIVFYLQQSYFSKSEFFAERIRMSFRSLLLTNIPASQAYMEKNPTLGYCVSFGEYILTKVSENIDIKDKEKYILAAFENKDMSVDDYISYLYEESKACGMPLNKVKLKRMKEALEIMICNS